MFWYQSHTGIELTAAFGKVLDEFKLVDKYVIWYYFDQLHTAILIVPEILRVTCNNTSNNNAMIHKLTWRVPTFGEEASHTHCPLPMVKPVAKSMICQFDITRKDTDAPLAASKWEHELNELMGGQGSNDSNDNEVNDELDGVEGEGDKGGDINRDADNNNEGWIDKVELLIAKECEVLEKAIQPLMLALVKVDDL